MTDTTTKTEAEILLEQKERFFKLIADAFVKDPDRLAKITKMYEDYGDRLVTAPASSRSHYHNAFPGGYIDHVLHVHDAALEQTKVLRKMGGWLDYTMAELVMATLHHDLWKLGMPNGEPYYLVEESDWHRKNQGSMYKHNERLPYMKVTDGALFVLQQYGIVLTHKETLAIKLSDGLYDDANKAYLMNHGKFPMHTNLPYVVHWADHMSATIERDPLKQEFVESLTRENTADDE